MTKDTNKDKGQQEKARLHARNRNKARYDLNALIAVTPALADHVRKNKYGNDSVDFANPVAVKVLNQALLHHYYGIDNWEFPDKNLCPPIPGRADYIHHVADLLSESNYGTIPKGGKIACLDIGIGANCIYPIIGVTEYDWNFVGSDIDQQSITCAQQIIASNEALAGKIECRLQSEQEHIFTGIINPEEKIDITICNPPFHASVEDALNSNRRKVRNLKRKSDAESERNFAGVHNELIYPGGEMKFIQTMIKESKAFSKNCFWFTTLVSKQSHLRPIYNSLEKYNAFKIRTIAMGTGNKSSRIVAWTFLPKEDQKKWVASRWKSASVEA